MALSRANVNRVAVKPARFAFPSRKSARTLARALLFSRQRLNYGPSSPILVVNDRSLGSLQSLPATWVKRNV